MEPKEILDWIYDCKLIAGNKKASRLLYKRVVDKEDYYPLSSEVQKNKLRTMENREKTDILTIIKGYEKLLIERYFFDFDFTLDDLHKYYLLAQKMVKILSLFQSHISSHRNQHGRIIEFFTVDGFTTKESLFFAALSGQPMVIARDGNTQFLPDNIFCYPRIASDVMRIDSLRKQISELDMYGKTFVWSMVFFGLQMQKIDNEVSVTEVERIWDKTHESLLRMSSYIDSLPLHTTRYQVLPPAKQYPTTCMMDILYDFRIHFMQLISAFIDRHNLNSVIYLCPLLNGKDGDLGAALFADSRNEYFLFYRTTFGHYIKTHINGNPVYYYCELTATDNDDKNGKFIGTAYIHRDFDICNHNPICEQENIEILGFEYTYDGQNLTIIDDYGNVIWSLRRIETSNITSNLKRNTNEQTYNHLVEKFGFADISKKGNNLVFEFGQNDCHYSYNIDINADPRLKFVRLDDIAYLYESSGTLYLIIEYVGYILIGEK